MEGCIVKLQLQDKENATLFLVITVASSLYCSAWSKTPYLNQRFQPKQNFSMVFNTPIQVVAAHQMRNDTYAQQT